VIPKFFLQDFNLVSHPETGKPWFVPTSLAPRTPTPSEQQPDAKEHADADKPSSDSATSKPDQSETKADRTKRCQQEKTAGPTSYMLARQDLIACQGSKHGYSHAQGWRKLIVLNHSSAKFKSAMKQLVWREDMGSLVLELMRRRLVEELVYYSKLSEDTTRNAYVVRRDTWDDINDEQYNGHRGCVLWLGEGETGPGPRAIVDVPDVRFGRKIPVHNMHTLLGPDHVARLREEAGLFRAGSLFMLVRARTLDLQLKLWKLQGYLAHPFVPPMGRQSSAREQRADGGDDEE